MIAGAALSDSLRYRDILARLVPACSYLSTVPHDDWFPFWFSSFFSSDEQVEKKEENGDPGEDEQGRARESKEEVRWLAT